jgi:hypothetical protein
MQRRFTRLSTVLGGPILALLITGIVLGYSGEIAASVEMSAPSGPQPCGTPITITALIQDIDGKPIEGQPVTWSFESGNVAGDTILDTTTTTNANGIATTQVQFACVPHTVTFGAVADLASGSVAVVVSGQGLPRTDTAPESSFAVMALAALAVAIGFGTILRRFAADRR